MSRKKKNLPSLTVSLNDPALTVEHRAGLAGLASTILAMRRIHVDETSQNLLNLCSVTSASVSLRWETDAQIEALLTLLLTKGLALDAEGLMDFPAHRTHRGARPDHMWRVRFQEGLAATLLQHGQSRKHVNPTDHVTRLTPSQMAYTYRPLLTFKHRTLLKPLVKALLKGRHTKIASSLLPGANVQHAALSGTSWEVSPAGLLALAFLPVAVWPLRIGEGFDESALFVPEVTSLLQHAERTQRMTRHACDLHVCSVNELAYTIAHALHPSAKEGAKLGRAHLYGRAEWNTKQRVRENVCEIIAVGEAARDIWYAAQPEAFAPTMYTARNPQVSHPFFPSRALGVLADAIAQHGSWWPSAVGRHLVNTKSTDLHPDMEWSHVRNRREARVLQKAVGAWLGQ